MATKKRRWESQDDPRMHTPEYLELRRQIQEEVATRPTQCQADHCLLPGVPVLQGGRRGPAHIDVGHITPAITDPRQYWTRADLRPEHRRCNRSAGATIGRARTAMNLATRRAAQALNIRDDDW